MLKYQNKADLHRTHVFIINFDIYFILGTLFITLIQHQYF